MLILFASRIFYLPEFDLAFMERRLTNRIS